MMAEQPENLPPEDRWTANLVHAACVIGLASISGLLAWKTVVTHLLVDMPMEFTTDERLWTLTGGAVAGSLWGLVPRLAVRRSGRGAWLMVFLGLVGAAVLGQALQSWLITTSGIDPFFPLTRLAWNRLVHDPRGFCFFLFAVGFTFAIDMLLLPVFGIGTHLVPIAVMSGGPLVGAIVGSLLGWLLLRLVARIQTADR